MLDIERCKSLSDHPQGFERLYAEILATAQVLPDNVLFLEVGTRAGGSALLTLMAINDSGKRRFLVTVDPYGGKTFESFYAAYHNFYDEPFYHTMMHELSGFCLEHNLNHAHFKLTSADFMITFDKMNLWQNQQVLERSFGYIYLDGEHTPEAVEAELTWCLPRLVDGGLLVIDDIDNIATSTLPLIQDILKQSQITPEGRAYYHAPITAQGNLVLTIAIGEDYQRLARITHPRMRVYADRIGAEFMSIDKPKISTTTAHWEKFQIRDLLKTYARVLYIDTDILVRDDCPDLFELVPETHLGMFNEAPFTDRSRELLIDCCKAHGQTLPNWNGCYHNTGVIVASQAHRMVFTKPEKEIFNFWEQTFLNMRIAQLGTPIFPLNYKLNRMSCIDGLTGEHRLASYLVHYAGAPTTAQVCELAARDDQTWKARQGDYRFTQHIHIVVSGGLGDQVQAEPAIRFMRAHVYPEAHITVSTHWPRLFQHLDVEVCTHADFRPKFDTPYWRVQSLPPPESINWMVLSNLLCHTVDYCSSALLRRTLPLCDKRINLEVLPAERDELSRLLDGTDPRDLVLVHAGRHWNTKTFPQWWWQEVIDRLAKDGHQVCLIGQDDDTRGTVAVVCPLTGIDLRNKTSLGVLIALCAAAPILVSNDSAPIHLAGAFNNGIVLIPSTKHPDHVLPWRYSSMDWRARALYTRLTIDDASSRPTDIHGSSAEFEVKDWANYLPRPPHVIETVAQLREEIGHANICVGQ